MNTWKVATAWITENQTENNKKCIPNEHSEWEDESQEDPTPFFRISSSQTKQRLDRRYVCGISIFCFKDTLKQSNYHLKRNTAYKNKRDIFWDNFDTLLEFLA